MATLTELVTLFNNSTLRNRVTSAAIIKAQVTIADATAPAARKTWVEAALANTSGTVEMLFKYILAANSAAELSAITGAADADVQMAVNNAVDQIYPEVA
jgi:hypothetical protein